MIRPRLKFETAEDRRKAAEKIRAEAEQVSRLDPYWKSENVIGL